MTFLSSKTAGMISDAICSLLLGTAFCALLFPALRMDVGWGECLLLMIADTLLVILFSRRWWILPAFLGAAILLTVIITAVLEADEAVAAYINGFFSWCVSGYKDTLPYSTDGSIIIVHAFYALPVAALGFLFYRRLFFFYLLPPAILAMLLAAALSQSIALWPIVIMLLFVLFVSLAKMRGNKISHQQKNGITSAMLSISAIMLMPVLLLAVFLIAPANNKDWQCKPLVNAVSDISDYLGFSQNQSPADGSFNMGVTGFSPLENRLGGNITANNDIVLSVNTSTPVRLTGAVFDAYDGTRWYDSYSRQRHRYQSIFSSSQKVIAFCLNLPDGVSPEAAKLIDAVTMPASFEVTGTLKGRTLFIAGKLLTVTSKKPETSDLYFNNQAELFTLNTQGQFSYAFDTVVFNTEADNYDNNMLALEALAMDAPDPSIDPVSTAYLSLPASLPPSVSEAARTITADCITPYQKALAIKNWLYTHCTYSLTPGDPTQDEDFVASFLEHRKGYCVYFASAMTIMSRCVGLPARYVIGFGLKSSPYSKSDTDYVATNATSHAWTEVYFRGIGWVPFDATGWNADEDATVDTNTSESDFIPPVSSSVSKTALDSIPLFSNNDGIPPTLLVLLILLAGFLAAVILFFIIRYISLLRSGYDTKHKVTTPGDRLTMYYRKILHQAACMGIHQHPSDTIQSFALRLEEKLTPQHICELFLPVMKMRFGCKEPTEEEVRLLSEFFTDFEKRLRHELGFFGYLFARIIKKSGRP